ncbi:Phosphatase [Phytophthora megakarya]|uniref:Phosphatase n=1 Tax=Phytophthora megakarya TaxID=4795 RepID=A0A225VZX7_9STRA|nr:Phosphatase [Phytophthora megakarya]
MSSKIKDGLFMGDIDAAQDADFLQLNGIMHIINCVPRQVPNIFQQSLGLSYSACDLDEVLRRPFFDLKNREFMHIIQLIDRALERTESVLVHSLTGINRSPSIMIGYLMVTYCWGLDKAHEFVMTKRTDMKLHESYIDQLCLLEAQIQQDRPMRATERQLYEWNMNTADPKSDEVVLIHTFLNTACAPDPNAVPERRRIDSNKHYHGAYKERRLTWIDQTPEMRKLHPSLLIRPERPPNISYNKMAAANGWVDLLNPSPTLSHEAKIKRLHSFSAPKRTEILDDEASTSPSTVSEELEFMPEETSRNSTPRYLRHTLASINSRPRRVSSSRPTPTAAPGGRVFYNVDFPLPETSTPPLSSRSRNGHILTGSMRRSMVDPLAHQSKASVPTRPRTAPARIRKDVETKDVLQSKKVDLNGFNRITIDPKTPYRMHSSLDYTADMDALSGTSTRTRRTSTSTTTGFGRAKISRASWR